MNEHLKPTVVIIGLNRLTKEVIDSLELKNNHQIAGVIDTGEGLKPNSFKTKYAVFNSYKALIHLIKNENIKFVVLCMEDSKHKEELSEYIEQTHPDLRFLNVVHPSAVIGKTVILGKGTIIGAKTVINSDTVIGDFCLIKDQVSIGHDGFIKNFVTIQTNATIGGQVSIGNHSRINTGSKIINNVQIGRNCLIKESTLVLKDIPDGGAVAGVPAKLLNRQP